MSKPQVTFIDDIREAKVLSHSLAEKYDTTSMGSSGQEPLALILDVLYMKLWEHY